MKNLIKVIFAATLILSGFVECYAADELSESEAREQIAYYMEGQRIADADNSFEELALQEYDMDCMVKTYKMSEMLKTYNKGGKFKDTLSDVKYFVPGITKSGEYCYFTFEVKDGKIEAADGAFGLEYFYDCRFDESKYPQLVGEKVQMVEYGYNLPYGCIFTHVKTDKNEYIIQYSESLIHEITGIKSGELLYAKDFYKIMNKYYDENIKYEYTNLEDMVYGSSASAYLRKKPLEGNEKTEKQAEIFKLVSVLFVVLLFGSVLLFVIRRRKGGQEVEH